MLALIPAEFCFPRIASRRLSLARLATALAMGMACVAATVLLTPLAMPSLIPLLAHLQIVSMSRLPIPVVAGRALSLLIIDFAAFLAHVIFHRVPPLWTIHSIHHSDEQVAASTGLLHHPLEAVLVALLLLAFCVVFGVPLVVIAAYGVIAQGQAIISHANLDIPAPIDRLDALGDRSRARHAPHASLHRHARGQREFRPGLPLLGLDLRHLRGPPRGRGGEARDRASRRLRAFRLFGVRLDGAPVPPSARVGNDGRSAAFLTRGAAYPSTRGENGC